VRAATEGDVDTNCTRRRFGGGQSDHYVVIATARLSPPLKIPISLHGLTRSNSTISLSTQSLALGRGEIYTWILVGGGPRPWQENRNERLWKPWMALGTGF
jgi:hypothetical protein